MDVLETQPLAGLKLAVLSYDLQQKEHRGIAVFSKALLKALKGAGAELWLLADLDPINNDSGILRAPKSFQKEVYLSRVLDSLANGYESPLSRGSEQIRLGTRNRYIAQVFRLVKMLFRFFDIVKLRFSFSLSKLPSVRLADAVDNPYLRLERLQYLSDIDGILCARYFYLNHYRAGSRKKPRPIQLELAGFHAVISTSPSNIQAKNGKTIFQVIHDLIPLEYVPASGEHVGLFSQRLLSASKSFRFFVSKSTLEKYNRLVPQHHCSETQILVQPPSLELTENSAALGSPSHRFTPYRYILFNSSVEPRKNLLFLINAFRASGLADQNIQLCVTGQVKNDSYSKAISMASKNYNAVVMTGYVDEATKANLFLNALIVVSPSTVEGFGIPVLDAACLGAPVIASQTASHCEIRSLHDFDSLVKICDIRKSQEWAIAMQELAKIQIMKIKDIDSERQNRILRYKETKAMITSDFQEAIIDAFKSGRADNGALG
jgi:glycosyltransferase involved in cell wall biosynthesis